MEATWFPSKQGRYSLALTGGMLGFSSSHLSHCSRLWHFLSHYFLFAFKSLLIKKWLDIKFAETQRNPESFKKVAVFLDLTTIICRCDEKHSAFFWQVRSPCSCPADLTGEKNVHSRFRSGKSFKAMCLGKVLGKTYFMTNLICT